MFYLGGSAPKANIEVHDVQFVAANDVTEAYPILMDSWFGEPSSLHIDAYATVTWADGYDVGLRTEPSASALRLYFVNMGGTVPGALQETHEFGLFVSDSLAGAKKKALTSLLVSTAGQHHDNFMDVDDCLILSALQGMHVHLAPNPHGEPVQPAFQGYITRKQMMSTA
jgi:hypothetical protein